MFITLHILIKRPITPPFTILAIYTSCFVAACYTIRYLALSASTEIIYPTSPRRYLATLYFQPRVQSQDGSGSGYPYRFGPLDETWSPDTVWKICFCGEIENVVVLLGLLAIVLSLPLSVYKRGTANVSPRVLLVPDGLYVLIPHFFSTRLPSSSKIHPATMLH